MYPKVYDVKGEPRDWEWLTTKYPGTIYGEADTEGCERVFVLTAVRETIGPATVVARVYNQAGVPITHADVAFHWPEPENPIYVTSYKEPWFPTVGAVGLTNNEGHMGFGIGADSFIGPGGGPHTLWILHPDYPSDALGKFGWLGGTNHAGPLSMDFQLQEVVVEPPPVPATPETRKFYVTGTIQTVITGHVEITEVLED